MSIQAFLLSIPFVSIALFVLGIVVGFLSCLKYMQYKTRKMMQGTEELMGEMFEQE